MENLHKYKLHRKQVGLLWPEGDHQGRPLAHTTKRLARVKAQLPVSWGARLPGRSPYFNVQLGILRKPKGRR